MRKANKNEYILKNFSIGKYKVGWRLYFRLSLPPIFTFDELLYCKDRLNK